MSSGSLYEGSSVRELSNQDFEGNKLMRFSGKNVYLMVYAPWCPHCISKVEIWKFLGDQYNKQRIDGGKTVIASVNSENPKAANVVSSLDVAGYPSFFKVDGKGTCSPLQFEMPFDIHSFIKEHCGLNSQCQLNLMKNCPSDKVFCQKRN